MPTTRNMMLLLTLPLLVACAADPMAEEALVYQSAMEPVMTQNAALAAEFLELALKLDDGGFGPDRMAKRWHRKVLPLSEEVATSVNEVSSAHPELSVRHQALGQAWKDRAQAYTEIDQAWSAGDPSAMDSASKANVQAKLAEEAALADLNALLGPHGVALDPFPEP
ncbi:MAG: putative lipoprotein [Cognaticolwellia sp.]|jgi:predicted lipoprotein